MPKSEKAGTLKSAGDNTKKVIYVGRGSLVMRDLPVLEQGIVTEVAQSDYDIFLNMRGVHPVKGFVNSVRANLIKE